MSKDLIVQPRLFTDAMLGIAPQLDEAALLAAIRSKVREEQVLTQLGVAQEDQRTPDELSEDMGILQEVRRSVLANLNGPEDKEEYALWVTERLAWLKTVSATLAAWEDQRRRKMAAKNNGLKLAS